jgi:hypothetical protein
LGLQHLPARFAATSGFALAHGRTGGHLPPAGWLVPHSPPQELRVYGPLGVAELDRAAGTLILRTSSEELREELSGDWNEACRGAQLRHFLARIDSAPRPRWVRQRDFGAFA